MSEADLLKWEARYGKADRGPQPPPESFVVDVARELRRRTSDARTAVDVAGGTGRHARWLAKSGWHATLVDISPTGLAIAHKATPNLHTVAADLEVPDAMATALPASAFDLVVCTWFLPAPRLWARLVETLRPGGSLVYVQPTHRNLERHAKPSARFLFANEALSAHFDGLGLRTVRVVEGWDDRGHHTARGWAQRP